MKSELERRVAELEAVNGELQSRLTSLDMKPPYSDYETDSGSTTAGSPRRPPLPLTIVPLHFQVDAGPGNPPLAISPHHYVAQRSQDLTSDYLSDQEAALSSPQVDISDRHIILKVNWVGLLIIFRNTFDMLIWGAVLNTVFFLLISFYLWSYSKPLFIQTIWLLWLSGLN